MSNKTILQTNNTNLASYTDRVTALINTANSLPEAGGGSTEDLEAELAAQETLIANITTALQNKASGGSGGGSALETCDVSISTMVQPGSTLIYVDENFTIQNVTMQRNVIYKAIKGTVLAAIGVGKIPTNCTLLFGTKSSYAIYEVTGG